MDNDHKGTHPNHARPKSDDHKQANGILQRRQLIGG